jgi:VanZ family protein
MFNQSLHWAALRGVEQVEVSGFVAYLPSMVTRISAVAGWLALAFIVYATLSPIDDRPVIAGAQLEHFAAFAVVGLAFGLAYPRRVFLVATIILISAFGLEALQLLTADRHARLLDAVVKAAGGICGIGIGQLAQLALRTQIKRAG